MRKNPLRESPMSDVYVDQAANWAKRLTQTEARGPGDLENAWRRLEARYGVPWRVFWSLRYRKPSDIGAALYARLEAAYQAECERQMRRLEHALEITKQTSRSNPAVVAEVQAVVDTENGILKKT